MIVLPEGIYHRFTLDEHNYIQVQNYIHLRFIPHHNAIHVSPRLMSGHGLQAMRLFVGDPVWTPLNRPQDDHASRKKYMDTFLNRQNHDGSVAVT